LRLKALLADIGEELPNVTIGEASNGTEALERLQADDADIALVDIRMPRMDGIELAGHLARLQHPPAVVFVTAYDQYAVKAFELNAVDYLLKPVSAGRLAAALRKAIHSGALSAETLRELSPEGRRHLPSIERGRLLLVPVSQILYLKAELKYVTARTRDRDYLLEESLTNLELEFAHRFVRIHRNCLVAREAIAGFERATGAGAEIHWTVLVRDLNEPLAVSRRQWPAVKAAIHDAGRVRES
jgi:two-component system response regulator AlgR